MKEKMKWITTYVILGALLAGVVVNAVNGVRTMNMIKDLNTTVLESQEEEGTKEDDVMIGDIYRIESTVHISDAYKSGDTSALSDRDKETLDMASEVLDEIIEDDMTPYEKELAVYEWMTSELGFDEGSLVVIPTTMEDCDNPYGVLKYHNAVCVGYATTFRLFMQMMDIECMVVHDTGCYHSWNLVKLDDNWYHTDIYSDAGTGGYANFNMNDMIALQGHDWDTSFFPAANGLEYNVGYQNREELSDIFDLPKYVSELVEAEESTCTFVGFEGGLDKEEMQLVDQMATMIQDRIWNSMDYENDLSYAWVAAEEDSYYLSLTVTYYDFDDDYVDSEIDEDDYQKMEEAVDEYFPYSDEWEEDWGEDGWYEDDWYEEDWGEEDWDDGWYEEDWSEDEWIDEDWDVVVREDMDAPVTNEEEAAE